MHKKFWGIVVLVAPLLAGCAIGFDDSDAGYDGSPSASDHRLTYNQLPRESGKSRVEDSGQAPLECVPFARDHSGVKIFGDAYTWWDQAAAKYERSDKPESGAVMVLSGYAGPNRGHVAVVQKVISSREIRVDHANWLDDGSIYINDPVADVSAGNDWSAVRVFNIQTGAWGGNIYPVKGFILPPGGAPPDAPPVVTAHAQKPLPRPASSKPKPARAAPVEQSDPYDLTPDDRALEPDEDAPLASHVQKPPPKTPAPKAAQPLASPLGPHDLTPEDLELEPESPANSGPVALVETAKKTR
jgi:hypothetical protein